MPEVNSKDESIEEIEDYEQVADREMECPILRGYVKFIWHSSLSKWGISTNHSISLIDQIYIGHLTWIVIQSVVFWNKCKKAF